MITYNRAGVRASMRACMCVFKTFKVHRRTKLEVIPLHTRTYTIETINCIINLIKWH